MMVAKESAEIGVFEGVIVGEGDFIDVIRVDKLLPRRVLSPIFSPHAVIILRANNFIPDYSLSDLRTIHLQSPRFL